mgnify:FL=1
MNDYIYFCAYFYKKSKINLSLYKEKQMKRRIDTFINRQGLNNYIDFITMLNNDNNLYEHFLNYITINVTEFFRNPEQWNALSNDILPPLIKNKKKLKMWSCACSSGEEVYSLQFILHSGNINYELMATDIDSRVLKKAYNGIYDIRQIKNINSLSINKYFTKLDDIKYSVKDEYKKNIRFAVLNLLENEYPQDIDLILCRNVLIYLTEKAKGNILEKLSNALCTGGVLFVGSTEQIIYPQNYGLKAHKLFFYKKV